MEEEEDDVPGTGGKRTGEEAPKPLDPGSCRWCLAGEIRVEDPGRLEGDPPPLLPPTLLDPREPPPLDPARCVAGDAPPPPLGVKARAT